MFRATHSHCLGFPGVQVGPELARGPVKYVTTEQVPELSRVAGSRMWWCLSGSDTCSLYPLPNNPLRDRDRISLSFYLHSLHSA